MYFLTHHEGEIAKVYNLAKLTSKIESNRKQRACSRHRTTKLDWLSPRLEN